MMSGNSSMLPEKSRPLTHLLGADPCCRRTADDELLHELGNPIKDERGRGLYQEIAMIEEQHVSQYESLMDGSMTGSPAP